MPNFDAALAAWKTPDFESFIRRELESLAAGELPLQQCLVAGSHVLPLPVKTTLLKAEESDGILCVRAGVFFKSTVAGCSCADDPTPFSELDEYCKIRIEIDMKTAAAIISPIEE